MSQVDTKPKDPQQPKTAGKTGPSKKKKQLPIWRKKYYDPVKEDNAKKNPWLIPGKLRKFGHTKNAYITGRAQIKSRVLQHIAQARKAKASGTAVPKPKKKKAPKPLPAATKAKKPAKEQKTQEGAKDVKEGKDTKDAKAQPTASTKISRKWYPLVPVPKKKKLTTSNKRPKAPRIRKSLQPGVILIILAGKYIGNRVVMIQALPSGLLVVTGPKKFNKIGLRRVHPAFVLATSVRIDISKITLPTSVNDRLFVPFRHKKTVKKTETEFFKESDKKDQKKKRGPNLALKKAQKSIDDQLIPLIKQMDPLLPKYLGSRLRLEKGQHPHLLKF